MPSTSYLPSAESDRVGWMSHYRAKLPVHGEVCGLSAQEITDTLADCDFYIWIFQTWNPAIQQDALQATSYKALVANGTGDTIPVPAPLVFENPPPVRPPGVLNRIANQVQRIKMSPGYTEGIGLDLGIIATPDNTAHPVPEFTVTLDRGPNGPRAKIGFTKYSHDGVQIESRRTGADFEPIGIALVKPWYDERPLAVPGTPETREYRIRWWDKNQANGDWSAIARVTLGA